MLLDGCSSTPRVDEHQLAPSSGSVLDGETVAVMTRIRQHVWKGAGIHAIGQRPGPHDTVLHDYDFDRRLASNLVVQDAEVGLGTREMLQDLEPTLVEALNSAGAVITDSPDVRFQLDAELTFGPTPAPAYSAHLLGKSLGSSLLTLGLGPSQYALRSDFQLRLRLREAESGRVVAEDTFTADESHAQSLHALDVGAQARSAEAARKLFRDTLEGQLSAFMAALPRTGG